MTVTDLPLLAAAWFDALPPHFVHIDLVDAIIPDHATMKAFERTVDRLELQGVNIRIVGLDPSHPALVG